MSSKKATSIEKVGTWETYGWRLSCGHFTCGYNVKNCACPTCHVVSIRPEGVEEWKNR
jgi:hypothetical protein